MSNITGNKKFVSMLLILLSLFVFIFFTQGYYSNLISTMDRIEKDEQTYKEKIKKADELDKIKNELKTTNGKKSELIKKYSTKLIENELIQEIYSTSINESTENGKMGILSLSMTEGLKNELGFIESKVIISARFSNKKVLKDYLDYLTKESKYKFFITSFKMPKIKDGEYFNVQIPLTLFYVDIK